MPTLTDMPFAGECSLIFVLHVHEWNGVSMKAKIAHRKFYEICQFVTKGPYIDWQLIELMHTIFRNQMIRSDACKCLILPCCKLIGYRQRGFRIRLIILKRRDKKKLFITKNRHRIWMLFHAIQRVVAQGDCNRWFFEGESSALSPSGNRGFRNSEKNRKLEQAYEGRRTRLNV